MNQPPTLDDLKLSTGILNFLAGGYQGIISYHTVLKRLGHTLFSEDALLIAEKILGKVADALIETYNGNPTFFASWSEVDSFEAATLIDALDKLRESLLANAHQLQGFLNADFTNPSTEQVEAIFAALARRLLGTDAYLQEQYRAAFAIGDTQQIDNETLLINALSFELDELTALGDKVFEKKLAPEDVTILLKKNRDLPFILSAQAHECRVLARTYAGQATFSAYDISDEEGKRWSEHSIDPVTAGYFVAYGLDIIDLVAWGDAQFFDAAEIFSWKNCGFMPHAAATWKVAGFFAEEAIPWMKADYSPEAARAELNKGVTGPKKASSFTTKLPAPKSTSQPPLNQTSRASIRTDAEVATFTKSASTDGLKLGNPRPQGISLGSSTAREDKPKEKILNQNTQGSSVESGAQLKKGVFKARNTFTVKRDKG